MGETSFQYYKRCTLKKKKKKKKKKKGKKHFRRALFQVVLYAQSSLNGTLISVTCIGPYSIFKNGDNFERTTKKVQHVVQLENQANSQSDSRTFLWKIKLT